MAEQKTAIITGCSSGIGLATALLFLKKGYRVFGIDRDAFDEAKLESRDVKAFHFHKADMLEDGVCDAAVKACVETFGPRIDVLANVAGIMDTFASADTVTDAEWSKVLGVNLTAPTKMMRAVLAHMKDAKRGAIVNVSSKAGMSGGSGGIAYTASKHGLIGATRHAAWRFHEEGIRCNAVLPGAVGTNIGKGMTLETLDQAGYMSTAPVTKLHMPRETTDIEPEDIANAILFLASDEARMINGACLPVDRAWGVI